MSEDIAKMYEALQKKSTDKALLVIREVVNVLHEIEMYSVKVPLLNGVIELSQNLEKDKTVIDKKHPQFKQDWDAAVSEADTVIQTCSLSEAEIEKFNKDLESLHSKTRFAYHKLPQTLPAEEMGFYNTLPKAIDFKNTTYSLVPIHEIKTFTVYSTITDLYKIPSHQGYYQSLSSEIMAIRRKPRKFEDVRGEIYWFKQNYSGRPYLSTKNFYQAKFLVRQRGLSIRTDTKHSVLLMTAGLKFLTKINPQKYNLLKKPYDFYHTLLSLTYGDTLTSEKEVDNNFLYVHVNENKNKDKIEIDSEI